MGEILLDLVESVPSTLFPLSVVKREKSSAVKDMEENLDATFASDKASEIIYHRINGSVVSLRGWKREEYFESDPGVESKIGDDTLFVRIPSHRLYFKVNDGDWLEMDGIQYNVILSKKSMGGTSALLLQIK